MPSAFSTSNSLGKFKDQNQDKKSGPDDVYGPSRRSPFAQSTQTARQAKDLEGRVSDEPAADGAFAQWKAFAMKEERIDELQGSRSEYRIHPGASGLDGKSTSPSLLSRSRGTTNRLQTGLNAEDIKNLMSE